MAGPSVSNIHIASQLRQPGSAYDGSPITGQQDYTPVVENTFLVWKELQHHLQFAEYYWQISECLRADDDVWYHLYCLRSDPRAHSLVLALGLVPIKLVPPLDIWGLLVQLRCSPNWPLTREVILMQLQQSNMTPDQVHTSTRDSHISQRSTGHLSTASIQSSRFSSASSMSTGSFVQIEGSGRPKVQTPSWTIPENKPLPPDPSTQVHTLKPPRMAPDGYRFVCPHKQCKDKFAFKKLGAYENHMSTKHPQDTERDAYQHLKSEQSLYAAPTPIKSDADDQVDAEQGSEGSYPEKKALSDGIPTKAAQEYHQSPNRPSDLQYPSNYFRKTGVHNISFENDAPGLAASYLHLDFDGSAVQY